MFHAYGYRHTMSDRGYGSWVTRQALRHGGRAAPVGTRVNRALQGPSEIRLTEDLPRTATGRLLKRDLRRDLGGQTAAVSR